MPDFPSLRIEGVTISRAICGTNALLGYSHVSPGRDAWIREHFTAARIARVFAHCLELGVNAVMGPLHPRLVEALDETERIAGARPVWVSTTDAGMAPRGREREAQQARAAGKIDEMVAIARESTAEQVAALRAARAPICLFHGQWTDRWPSVDGRLYEYDHYTQLIRQAEMVPGTSVHQTPRLDEVAHGGYDIAVFAVPVNRSGWSMRPDQATALEIIGRVGKPVIAIKTLACGRYETERDVPAWLEWAVDVPGVEAIALGLMVEQEADQSIPILRERFARKFGA
jgi:hypothetical protein